MTIAKQNLYLVLVAASIFFMSSNTKAYYMSSDSTAPEPQNDQEFRQFAEECYDSFRKIAGKEAIITNSVELINGPKNFELLITYNVKIADEEIPLGPFLYKCVKEPSEDTVIYFGDID